ncbi:MULTISPECIES: galactose ABC transporter substrate-binding protein [Clostridium]|uniref:D-galactose/methyl-galactoside binding periplasmic protein MglB n=1 Tax=Clostridium cibarium TaxID=2762247 RepID=A0ABR8PP28_9CLOT|nr:MULTISPECIES: galactose ABC transporter substrate-binding protein [Clostridium]MBD7909935.1 galactose ABC transporter substrate-binding protein [Clostridium cibarium]
MYKFRKIIGVFAIIIFATVIFQGNEKNALCLSKVNEEKTLKIGVMEYKSSDQYILEIHKSLEQIQRDNLGKVEFLFYDAKDNQEVQNASINKLLQEGIDLLVVNIVDINTAQNVINMVKQKNIPIIFYNREPLTTDAIKSYNRAVFIGTDAAEAGILQGKIFYKLWSINKKLIDKNRDNKLQYVMLKGEPYNIETLERTRYSVLTINSEGIGTEELTSVFCSWDGSTAESVMNTVYLSYGNKIEAIISNNDAMAIGAIRTLQKYGYNTGDPNKMIPIVGVDAIPIAIEYIEKGYMTGTVVQDVMETAKAIYTCGLNLINRKSAIDGTAYNFDDTGVSIRIPYKEYVK